MPAASASTTPLLPYRGQRDPYRWDGIDELVYKEHDTTFRDVTRRVLFDREHGQGVQVRYFEVGPGGWSTLEHHGHTHQVIILRGSGTVLVGHELFEVHEHDLIFVPSHAWHQFRATHDEPLGFECIVTVDRDRPVRPTPDDLADLRTDPAIADFIRV